MIMETTELLISLAKKYEGVDFIASDPISFAHRYKEIKDIEIAAFMAQWVAYGKRELFLKVLDNISKDFNTSPYSFIASKTYNKYKYDNDCLYRFYKGNDFYLLCEGLYNIYINIGKEKLTMQDVLKNKIGESTNDAIKLISTIESLFPNISGIPQDTKSACKRLCMFLRWMVRKNSIVDFGIWNIISPKNLIIPLDTHVFQQSKNFQLTMRKTADMKTAMEITDNLKKIFPNDPTKFDFALFGYGVNNSKKKEFDKNI